MSRLRRSRMSRECGAARRLRWPSARGPNSDAPSIQPTMRHAAAKAQIRQAGLPMQRTRDPDERVFQDLLDAGGAIGEAPPIVGLEIDRLVGVSRPPEEVDESRRIRPTGRRLVFEVFRREG